MHVRICRDCGEEYRPEIVRCADCGGELEDRHVDEAAPPPVPATRLPAAPQPADLSQHRVVFVSADASDLVPLAERLREAGIDFHLGEKPAGPRSAAASFSLLVHEDHCSRALGELAPLLGEGMEPGDLHALETNFANGQGYVRCPACSCALTPGAGECPECGLGLSVAGAACSRCGAPLDPEQDECPGCGVNRAG